MNNALSRRTLLGAGAALGVGSTLAGCRSETGPGASADPSSGGSSTASGGLPTHIPYEGVTPDIPAANDNAINGFLTVPEDRPSVLGHRSTLTEPVTVLGQQSVYIPPPMAQNAFWQNLNDHFGVTFDITSVPGTDYVSKFQTTISAGDLPDLVRVPSVPRLDQVLSSSFADLSEFLAGDAIEAYPMLANIPTLAWNSVMFDGRIMGVPKHMLPLTSRVEARTDVLADLGVDTDFGSAAEFLDFCREVTDADAQRWAMVQPITNFVKQMCGVPNQWQVSDGAFVNEVETEQYKKFLELMATLQAEKLIHPQAFTNPQVALLFQTGQYLLFEVGGAGFTAAQAMYEKVTPGLTVAPVIPPKYDGGGPAQVYTGSGSLAITAIPRSAPKEKIAELLNLLDGLAAPFGTAEWVAVEYGKDGESFTWVDGSPSLTDAGTQQKVIMNYCPGSPMVMFSPGHEEVTRAECAYEAAVGADALPLPTNGLFSDSATSTGAVLNQKIKDATLDVITGRKKVSDWDRVVDDWRNAGGDKLRAEYEESLASQ